MQLKNFTLLYVEDDIEIQNHIKLIFEDNFKSFYQASSAEEGLHIFKEKNPDIVLTDINMSGLDGLTMAQEIKKIDKYRPIIVMSAFDDKETLIRAINIGIDYFTPKPIDIDILRDKLHLIAHNLQNKIDVENARKKEISDLYNLAHYDTLTKVLNRFLFDIRLDQALSNAKRNNSVVTLFFIDLDNFKTINDRYGHSTGDKILQSVSNNIKKIIRVEDTLARIGGDEFAIIVEDTMDKGYLNNLASKIVNASSFSMVLNGNTITTTCSVGISKFPQDCNTKEDLIHFADIAMYKAKKLGKSKYTYYHL
jgi:diguanylate cyclase (GGDEF)-like protein